MVDEAKKEIFPIQAKLKAKMVPLITMPVDGSLSAITEAFCKHMYPLLPENDTEAWSEDFDNQYNLESSPPF